MRLIQSIKGTRQSQLHPPRKKASDSEQRAPKIQIHHPIKGVTTESSVLKSQGAEQQITALFLFIVMFSFLESRSEDGVGNLSSEMSFVQLDAPLSPPSITMWAPWTKILIHESHMLRHGCCPKDDNDLVEL